MPVLRILIALLFATDLAAQSDPAVWRRSMRPTSVEPVNETMSMSG